MSSKRSQKTNKKEKGSKSLSSFPPMLLCILGILLLTILNLYLRPLWPIDETRYASVAWEMWNKKEFLVPQLNGQPYSHKPPLLFWFIHLGWTVFGVVEWWPRILPGLFGIVNLFLIRRLAHTFFTSVSGHVVLIFSSMFMFLFFSITLMFDMLLMCFVSLAYLSLFSIHEKKSAILTFGLAIGLGILTKGPVMILHVLPFAILYPLILGLKDIKVKTYYFRLFLGTLMGILISLCWAISASIKGGDFYRKEILWGQTAGRIAKSFAHSKPWWYYLLTLPLILLPWTGAFVLWIRNFANLFREKGIWVLTSWAILTTICFSFISGKQMFYIMPILIPMAIIIAKSLSIKELTVVDQMIVNVTYLFFGITLTTLSFLVDKFNLPTIFETYKFFYGLPLIVFSLLLIFYFPKKQGYQAMLIFIQSLLLFSMLLCGPVRHISKEYDLKEVSLMLSRLEGNGYQIIHVGKYHGEYHFLGRLVTSFTQVDESLLPQLLTDPKKVAVWVLKDPTKATKFHVIYHRHYAGKHLFLVGSQKHPLGAKEFLDMSPEKSI